MWLKPNADVGDILSIWQYALTVDGYHGHGTKSRVSGVGVEPNRPATNFPRISVDSNRFNCLLEKSGLGIEPRRLLSPIKQV